MAKLAVSGRAGTEVVQVTAPDTTDVTSLGIRASDGGSIYRPPNEQRYCTLAHLDTEQQILTAATRTVPQLVSHEQARAAVDRTDLSAGQRDAVITMLTAATTTTALVAAAGAGKTHTMAEFARLWTTFTGRRVIGLATATNAARVLASEGLAESYNIAAFLGKIEGSGKLRRPVPLHQDDVLVLDEASQLSTTDLAMVQEAARTAGARLALAGDTEQLGAVEAGGMFRLLAREVPCAELHEVRRFDAAWEAGASVRLRAGDFTAYADYDRHGRMRGADHEAAYDRTASMWLADHLQGKNVLLLAGSNSEAAELSRRVQAKLIQLERVQRPHAALADGNQAGTGDLIRARLNTKISAAGQELTNRDTLRIAGWRGPHAQVRRRDLDGSWTSPFLVSRAYLADSAELDYAGNTHVGQGRTVDTAHLLVTGTLSRRSLYVGLTRGRESNPAHIVTGTTAPPGASALPAGLSRIGGQGHPGPRRSGPVGHRADPPRPGTGRGDRPPAHPMVRRGQTVAVPAHRPADQGPAHRISSLPIRAGTLTSCPPAEAPRRPARRARHQLDHRPDHRRAAGRRSVHFQRPARPPPAASAARPRL